MALGRTCLSAIPNKSPLRLIGALWKIDLDEWPLNRVHCLEKNYKS